jgi:OOP family OmpA-OmpF porin
MSIGLGSGIVIGLAVIGTLSTAHIPQGQDAKTIIAEVVRTGSVIVRGIEFGKNVESPTSASAPALRQLRAMLLEHAEWTFEVQVHTNETGDPARDQALSSARAAAVVRWLTKEGIAIARLVPHGYGSSKPLAESPAGDGRLAHDRVELRKLNEE